MWKAPRAKISFYSPDHSQWVYGTVYLAIKKIMAHLPHAMHSTYATAWEPKTLSQEQRLSGDLGQFLKRYMSPWSDTPILQLRRLERAEFIPRDPVCSFYL